MELWRSILVLRYKLIALTASINGSAVAQHPRSPIRRCNPFINPRWYEDDNIDRDSSVRACHADRRGLQIPLRVASTHDLASEKLVSTASTGEKCGPCYANAKRGLAYQMVEY